MMTIYCIDKLWITAWRLMKGRLVSLYKSSLITLDTDSEAGADGNIRVGELILM